jgi:hypothetical protein
LITGNDELFHKSTSNDIALIESEISETGDYIETRYATLNDISVDYVPTGTV